MYKTYQTGGNFSLLDINALPDEEFEWLFGNVIEKNQAIAEYVAQRRPFRTVQDLKDCFYDYLFEMNSIGKNNTYFMLIVLFIFRKNKCSAQISRFPRKLELIISLQIKDYKTYVYMCYFRYKLKFAIPFVIHLQRGNKVETILAAMEERLTHATAHELNVTMEEICKICSKRIDSLVWPDV
ncbi:2-oxo-4-hydroxy-4-carboxy-5-ureidoimidazoline decarboxylase-like [Frieseomelitta varia]|uniref:2-oxo-4-hydroxy-4-carboxy-5-ureidoimidazoline decarboxylase-like n=1 Tax=Frieseomelitta varia TaxID=561572 RepID=UPI001CB6B43D|nr:2-oxo-4-hydroxy-4-carboxy-5-ureidoimidazoline decarboxylase-like [Frieseomelitta varia]